MERVALRGSAREIHVPSRFPVRPGCEQQKRTRSMAEFAETQSGELQRLQRGAARVRRRLRLRRFVALLNRTALPTMALLTVSSVLFASWDTMTHGLVVALAATTVWLATLGGIVWSQPVCTVEMLAEWDRSRASCELFVSAWCFLTRPPLSVAEQLHVRRADRELDTALAQLPRDLPIPLSRTAIASPLLLTGALLIVWAGQQLPRSNGNVSADKRAAHVTPRDHQTADSLAARTAAGALRQEAHELNRLAALHGSDRGQLPLHETLRQSLLQTAEELESGSPNRLELLRQLDQLARQTETLATSAMERASGANSQRDRQWIEQLAGRLRDHERQLARAAALAEHESLSEDGLAPLAPLAPDRRPNAGPTDRSLTSDELLEMLQPQRPKSFNERIAQQNPGRVPGRAPGQAPAHGDLADATDTADRPIPVPGTPIPVPGTPIPGTSPIPIPGTSAPLEVGQAADLDRTGTEQIAPGSPPNPGAGSVPPQARSDASLPETTETTSVAAAAGNTGRVESQQRAADQQTAPSSLTLESVQQQVAAVQEQALADHHIPLTRRRQVRSYFVAVRRLLEEPPAARAKKETLSP